MCDWFLKFVAPHAEALARAGASVAVVCRTHAQEFGGNTAEREALVARLREQDVPVIEVPGRVSSASGLAGVVAARRALVRFLPDVVHVHDNHDPRLLAICRGFPVVLTIHDPTPHPGARELGLVRQRIRKAWIRRALVLIVHGPTLLAEARSVFRSANLEMLPLGTETRNEPFPPPPQRTVLFFGRLQKYKGLDVLLEAMESIWRTRDDVSLVIAGEGPEAARIPGDRRIRAHLGYVPEERIDDLFASATLAVLPYTQASQSAVGMLALARGVPLIVSDVGALPELVPFRDLVVPPGDPARLAAAILDHLDHDAAFRRTILEHGCANYSWDRVAAESLAVYARAQP